MKRYLLILFALVAVCWTVLTLVNAVTRGKGHGAVFVVSLLIIGAVLVLLLWWVIRLWRGARG